MNPVGLKDFPLTLRHSSYNNPTNILECTAVRILDDICHLNVNEKKMKESTNYKLKTEEHLIKTNHLLKTANFDPNIDETDQSQSQHIRFFSH